MTSNRTVPWIALLLALLLTAGCGGPAGEDPGDDAPAAPTDVQATSEAGFVRVTWTDRSDDETGFAIFRAEQAAAGVRAGQLSEIGRTGPDATRFDDLTADPAARYRYAVAALDGSDAGPPTAAAGAAATATAVELRVDLATTGAEADLNDAALARYVAERPAVTVTRVDLPVLTDDRFGYYEAMFDGGAYDLDLVRLDVVWTGAFGGDLADLGPLGGAGVAGEHLPSLIENGTVDGRLVALPWFADVGLLYYRTDLLADYGYDAPPATWDELETMATAIQDGERAAGNAGFWGYVWQGTSYEGLTVNALEWLASAGGGTIVSADGVVTVDNPAAVAVVEQAAGWVGTISPAEVTTYAEESARSVFQDGDAAFMRNWPYAYALAQSEGSAVAGQVNVAPLPAGEGGTSAGALGGWYLGVPSASPNPVAAADLALFLSSEAEQAVRAAEGYWATRPAVYDDPEVRAALPIADAVGLAVAGAVARPSAPTGADYPDVSQAFYTAVHSVLTGGQSAADALRGAAGDIQDITGLPAGAP
jgi:trehalose/maltose transport system substrate-binding protein